VGGISLAIRHSSRGQNLKLRWWLGVAIAAVVGIGLYFPIPRLGLGQSSSNQSKDPKKAGKGADRALPVAAVATHKGDIDIYVTGLGSVTAYNTVTLKTRVDGQLDKVAFREGQSVKQGEVPSTTYAGRRPDGQGPSHTG
jgi:membrane fusion protein, multidrug efflux system